MKLLFQDKDECTLDEDDCDALAACTNNHGGFDCDCNTGYAGDGTSCTGEITLYNHRNIPTCLYVGGSMVEAPGLSIIALSGQFRPKDGNM